MCLDVTTYFPQILLLYLQTEGLKSWTSVLRKKVTFWAKALPPFIPLYGTEPHPRACVEVCYCSAVPARVPTEPEGKVVLPLPSNVSVFVLPPTAGLTTLESGWG